MTTRAVILILSCAGCFTSLFADGPRITYRLESDATYIDRANGILLPVKDRRTVFQQELRIFLSGKASKRVGYRIEPRFSFTSTRDTTNEFDWILDQGYAYLDFSDRVTFLAGKERVRWGTGMTYTPTDRWQSSTDPLDPTRYLEGVLVYKLDARLPLGTFTGVYSPARDNVEYQTATDHVVGFRYYKLIGTIDIYLSMLESLYFQDAEPSVDGNTYQEGYESNYGGAFAWDSGPAVFYGEGAVLSLREGSLRHFMDPKLSGESRLRAVIGASKQFNAYVSGYLETYYNGWGLSKSEYLRFREIIARYRSITDSLNLPFDPTADEWSAAFSNFAIPARSLHQWYIAANGNYNYKERWTVSGNAIIEPVDGTWYLYPLISYIGFENVDLMLGYSQVLGGRLSEKAFLPSFTALDFRFIIYF